MLHRRRIADHEGALAEVPAVQMRADDHPRGGAAGEHHAEVGGGNRDAAGTGLDAQAHRNAPRHEAPEPAALLLRDGVDRQRQRLARGRARAREQLAPALPVDEQDRREPAGGGRPDVIGGGQRRAGSQQPHAPAEFPRRVVAGPAEPDVHEFTRERRVRLREAEGRHPQAAREGSKHRDLVVATDPSRGGERLALGREAQRAQFRLEAVERRHVARAAREARPDLVGQALQEGVGGRSRRRRARRVRRDRGLDQGKRERGPPGGFRDGPHR